MRGIRVPIREYLLMEYAFLLIILFYLPL
jgi:hypothetical protein